MAVAKAPKLLARTMLGASVAAAMAVSGCSAGQVTQTDTQVAAVPGVTASVGDLSLQDMAILFPDADGYAEGGNAPFSLRIFNNSTKHNDTLVAVESPDAELVTLAGATPDEEEPSPSDEESPADEDSEDPQDPDADASDDEATSTPDVSEIAIDIQQSGYVMLVPGDGTHLQLTGLKKTLKSGSIVQVTFTFAKAGPVTVDVPMGLPSEAQEREKSEHHGEENAKEEH